MAELARATSNFSPQNKIGQGGFGMVYRGRLKDGRVVAIKRGKKDAYEQRLSVEFRTEVEMLSQVDHLNLGKLIGYVEEKNERILVVEYVPNGNLGEHLEGRYGKVLDMSKRLDIAIDVAHALTYLHLYADRPIIHRDIKSSNILLTDTYRAKVSDFGFSRVGPSTEVGATHVSTQVKGTAGYLDPEYLNTYQLNTKSDVYSFGILLVEILTGRRPIELRRRSEERVTVRWAFRKFVEGKVEQVMDPKLERSPAALSIIDRVAELAFACSAPTKGDRPSMKKAAEVLWEIRKDYLAMLQQVSKAERSESTRTDT
jgi:serine/threonine protein kinase